MTALPQRIPNRRFRSFPTESERGVLKAVRALYAAPRNGNLVTLAEVASAIYASTSHTYRQCQRLVALGLLERIGSGPNSRYVLPDGVPDQKAWSLVQAYVDTHPSSDLAAKFTSIYREVCCG